MVNKRTYLFGTILSIVGLFVADDATTKMAFVALGGFLAVAFNKDED